MKTEIEVISEIIDELLPLVDVEDNICGDMFSCCGSSMECALCLVKQIKKQYEAKTNINFNDEVDK